MESENNLSSENIKQIVISGNNIETLKNYPDNYFDAVVTDPPYGLGKEPNAEEMLRAWIDTGYLEVSGSGFMGKEWDAFVPQPLFWKEIFRVLKYGGHIVSFFGTRTYDWGCMAIRLAGFEIRDCIQWVYGSGFPKSHNISKAIDKMPKANNRLFEFAELLKHRRNELHFSLSQADDLICKGSTMYNFLEGRNINGVLKVYPPNKEYYEKIKSIYGIQGWDDIVENNLEIVGEQAGNFGFQINGERWNEKTHIKEITTEQAKEWEGWGSALKPANEPIVLARKPLEKGLSIAENVLKWGTGGLNIDVSRIGNELIKGQKAGQGFNNVKGFGVNTKIGDESAKEYISEDINGRFPANFIMTHHPDCKCDFSKYEGENDINEDWNCHDDCPIKILDEQSGELKSGKMTANHNRTTNGSPNGIYGKFDVNHPLAETYGDKGGASRFFYIAKANKWERNFGLDTFEEKRFSAYGYDVGLGEKAEGMFKDRNPIKKNIHPTVKPIKLMQYLVRMITPPNGIVLDPFAGSGTTGIACKIDGFEFVGLELSEDYTKIANARIESFQEENVFIDETIIYKNRNKEEDENEEEDDTNNSTQLSLF
jgi:DNA modification methylase